jgi:hypothetical protein
MIKERNYLNMPYASARTDSGTEFQGVFDQYLYNSFILHKVSLTARHTQTASVESLNRTINILITNYLNYVRVKTGKGFDEWTDVLDNIRQQLNAYRKVDLEELRKKVKPPTVAFSTLKPKYKLGDLVHRLLDYPKNSLNEKLGGNFRVGDLHFDPIPDKIVQIYLMEGNVNIRYMLDGIDHTSFPEWQLTRSKHKEAVREIKQILDIFYNRKEKEYYYKIQLFGEAQTKAGWYSKTDLLKTTDKLQEFIDVYNANKKTKGKKS